MPNPTSATLSVEFQRTENDRGIFACPECRTDSEADFVSRGEIVACPECGQCLASPEPIAGTHWDTTPPRWPFAHEKMSATSAIAMAVGIAAIGLIPMISLYLRLGAAILGLGVFLEGLGRIPRARRRSLQFRWDNRSSGSTPGSIKAVFATRNSLLDSVAIGCVIAALGCGLMWVLDLLFSEAGIKTNSVQGWLCVLLVPAVMVYCSYRAIRLWLDRRVMILCEDGIRIEHRSGVDTHCWDELREITAVHLGDAIDEDAIDFEFHTLRKKLRITRSQFPLIERIWTRVLQEASHQIRSGRLTVRTQMAKS